MTGTTLTSGFGNFIPNYWDRTLGDNLRPNLYWYDLGEIRKLPANFGTTIKIPRFKKAGTTPGTNDVTWSEATEGVVTNTCGASSEFVSGTLKKFKGAYRHSDLVIMTALSDVIQLSLEDLSFDLALKMDTHVRDTMNAPGVGKYIVPLKLATTVYPSFGGLSATVTTAATTKLTMPDIVRMEVVLEGKNNPRYPGTNKYALMIHPRHKYEIQTPMSGSAGNYNQGGWVDVNAYNNAEKIFNGEIGSLYGFKVISSTNAKTRNGLSLASISGAQVTAIAPRAYYVTEMSEMSARTYVKQLGSGGTADPTNDLCTVGAKVYFTAIPGGNKFSRSAGELRIIHLVTTTNTAVTGF